MSLNKETIKKIALSDNKNHALSVVREKLHCNYKIRSDFWRHEIYLEVMVDLIEYCLKKGLSIDQCFICSEFYENLLNIIKKSSSKLNNLVDFIMDNLKKLTTMLNDKTIKGFIDYINSTILIHFNLYKYVFCFEKDDNSIIEKKTLYTPSKELLETTGSNVVKPYDVWSYDKNLSDFESKENEIKNKFKEKREKLLAEEENALKLINYIKNDAFGEEKPLNEENINKLLGQITEPIVRATKQVLKCDIEEAQEKVENFKKKQSFIISEAEAMMKAKESVSITPKNKKK